MSRFLIRPLRLCIEFLAGFVGILVVLGALLVLRLNMAPLSSEFFTPYIETAIVSLVPGTRVSIAHSLLTWDNADRSITLHADGIRLAAMDGGMPIAELPALDIRVSVLGLFIGRIVPAGLRVGNPQVWLTRDRSGTLLFGGMAAKGGVGGDIKATLGKIADDFAHAHLTRKLEISDAVFSIHDEKTGEDWTIRMPQTVLEHHLSGSLTGEAKIEAALGKNPALAVVHYNYDPDTAQHELAMRFSGINPALFGAAGSKLAAADLPFTGEVSFVFDDRFDFAGGALDVHGDAGTLDYPEFWSAPCAIKSLDVKARYDHKTGRLDVSTAAVDFGGPKLTLSLTGMPPASQSSPPHDLDFELSAKLAALPMNDFAKIWPKPVIPGARDWIDASLSKGIFDRAEATFKGSLSWDDLDNLAITEGQGKVSAVDATVKYLDGMPPVVGAGASANFDLNQMTVTVSGGGIGDIQLQPSTILLSDFERHIQNIDLPLHVSGPISSELKLIDSPPLGYAKAIGLDPDSVTGKFNGTVELKFPLLAELLMKDINTTAHADIMNLASAKLVPGLDISQGNLMLDLDKTGFTLQGEAALSKVPLHVSWHEAFSESAGKPLRQVSVTGAISGAQWKDIGVKPLAKSQGPITVTMQMTQKNKKATSYSGALDMKAATVQIDELNWKKAAGEPAGLSFAADQPEGKNINVKTIEAYGPGLKIKGNAVFAAESWTPIAINFDPFIAGRNDARLNFAQAPEVDGKISLSVEGKAFDASGLSGDKGSTQPDSHSKEFRFKLDKLYTSADGFITNMQGAASRDSGGWSAISLHGLADGAHPLDINLAPQGDGRRTFSVTCDDFGKALKGLGFTNTVKGGKLKISGAGTTQKPRVIDGKIFVGSFEVKDLPVLVVLMNATSPFNLVNLFTGTLDFDKLEGKFSWNNDHLELEDIRAAGNSVGMTVDGKLDLNTTNADLHGTMAPFSMFNRIIGAIPLIGDVITGGEGQGVIGVTYTIRGPLDKPEVQVNPASLLTPGFLRNLFFGGGNGSDDAEAPASAPAASVEKTPLPAKTNINR